MGSAVIIEDDDDIRRLLEIVLEQSGFTVASATTGESGVELVASTEAEIVTVDVGLPDLDGIEVVRRVRPLHRGPIVVISARSSTGDRARATAAGADAYLTKPFRPRELRAALEEILAGAG